MSADEARVEEGNEIDRDAENEASRFLRERKASRKVEAAPSDTDHKAIVHVLFDQMPDTWDEGDIGILADAILEAGFSRSQPVQVEVTDDMVEKAAVALWRCDSGSHYYWRKWDYLPERIKVRFVDHARAALSAALGGESK